jgi:hypothetical protein
VICVYRDVLHVKLLMYVHCVMYFMDIIWLEMMNVVAELVNMIFMEDNVWKIVQLDIMKVNYWVEIFVLSVLVIVMLVDL